MSSRKKGLPEHRIRRTALEELESRSLSLGAVHSQLVELVDYSHLAREGDSSLLALEVDNLTAEVDRLLVEEGNLPVDGEGNHCLGCSSCLKTCLQ